jgi:hypothetical protein
MHRSHRRAPFTLRCALAVLAPPGLGYCTAVTSAGSELDAAVTGARCSARNCSHDSLGAAEEAGPVVAGAAVGAEPAASGVPATCNARTKLSTWATPTEACRQPYSDCYISALRGRGLTPRASSRSTARSRRETKAASIPPPRAGACLLLARAHGADRAGLYARDTALVCAPVVEGVAASAVRREGGASPMCGRQL